MIFFCKPERTCWCDFRRNFLSFFSLLFDEFLCNSFLFFVTIKNCASILVTRSARTGGVMNSEEDLQKFFEGNFSRVEFYENCFGMPSIACTHLLISRFFCMPSCVTYGCCNDSGNSAELRLDAPESASSERRQLMTPHRRRLVGVLCLTDVSRSRADLVLHLFLLRKI